MGYLCWYETSKSNASFLNFGDPVNASQGANHDGMNVFYTTSGNLAYVYGEWAYMAPATAAASRQARASGQDPKPTTTGVPSL